MKLTNLCLLILLSKLAILQVCLQIFDNQTMVVRGWGKGTDICPKHTQDLVNSLIKKFKRCAMEQFKFRSQQWELPPDQYKFTHTFAEKFATVFLKHKDRFRTLKNELGTKTVDKVYKIWQDYPEHHFYNAFQKICVKNMKIKKVYKNDPKTRLGNFEVKRRHESRTKSSHYQIDV